MGARGSGVILALDSGSGNGSPMMGGTAAADGAMDAMIRQFAQEVGPAGVRVCGIRTAGVVDTLTPEKLAGATRRRACSPADPAGPRPDPADVCRLCRFVSPGALALALATAFYGAGAIVPTRRYFAKSMCPSGA